MFDLLIKNGNVIDGSGKKRFISDIGIKDEKISFIGDSTGKESKEIINANGLIVSPGFIDTHTHHDGVLLNNPQHASSLRQGVTTEILGQDGLSYSPLSSENYKIQRKYLGGILGMPPDNLDMSTISAFRSNYHKKVSINTAYPVSHGALRLETVGFHDKPLRGKELERAKSLLKEGLEQGSVGLATGMSYHPNAWSDTEELIKLCEVVREKNGVYITHLRDVNVERGFAGGGIPEALEIGRRSGVRVHFSHTRTSAENAGQVSQVLELIDKAKDEGIDCTLELYPYPTGSSFLLSNLPSWAHEGGPDEILARLNDKNSRSKIIESFESNKKRKMDQILLSYLPNSPELEGMTVSQLSEIRGISMGNLICDILVEQDLQVGFWQIPPQSISTWRQISKDAMKFLSRPDYMIGSDSIRLGNVPHPRAYGTFPRFIGRLRRQFNQIISLEQMIQRICNNPAKTFNLTGRGSIKEDYFADIVIFDEEKIIDTATYDDSMQFPVGIPHVIVNGKFAVKNEKCTGIFAGHAIP